MHIKSIRIQGFKSYCRDVVIGPLEGGLNVIVGKNGSGKSSLLDAIEFGLKLGFRGMSAQEKKSLLHDDGSNLSAFVEIEFDNKSRQLPFDTNTVKFMRVLTAKKEKFLVNKHTCNDPRDIWFSLGFSNSFYHIKQGMIGKLVMISDEKRYSMFEEIGGGACFEKAIKQSAKSLSECERVLLRMSDSIENLSKIKEELEEQLKDLKIFTEADSNIRAIEACIFHLKIQRLKDEVVKLDDDVKNFTKAKSGVRAAVESKISEIERLRILKQDISNSIASIVQKKECANEELASLHTEKMNFEPSSNNITDDGPTTVNELLGKIKQEENKLKTETLNEEKLSKKKKELKDRLYNLEAYGMKVSAIIKERLNEDCDTPAERSVTEEISYLTEKIQLKQKLFEQDKLSLREEAEIKETLNFKIKKMNSELELLRDKIKSHNKTIVKATLTKSENMALRMEIQKAVDLCHLRAENCVQSKEDVMNKLNKVAGHHIIKGMEGVAKVIEALKCENAVYKDVLSGYYGMLVQNFECDESLYAAIESGVGNMLFYHIVENSRVGSEILRKFNSLNLRGEVYFIPLNQLKQKAVFQYPQDQEVTKLIDSLRFDEKLRKAMDYAFGNVAVCMNLRKAVEVSKLRCYVCVTPDGEKVGKRGCMTGGYIRQDYVRIKLFRLKAEIDQQIAAFDKEKQSLNSKLAEHETLMKHNLSEASSYDVEKSKLEARLDSLATELKEILDKTEACNENILKFEKRMNKLEAEINFLTCQRKAFERTSNDSLNQETPQLLMKKDREVKKNVKSIMLQIYELEKNINNQIYKKRQCTDKILKLRKKIIDIQKNEAIADEERIKMNNFKLFKEKVDELNITIQTKKADIEEFDKKLSSLTTEANRQETDITECSIELSELELKVEEYDIEISKMFEIQTYRQRAIKELNNEIMRKGPYSKLVTKYSEVSLEDLYRKLKQNRAKRSKVGNPKIGATERLEKLNDTEIQAKKQLSQLTSAVDSFKALIVKASTKQDEVRKKCFDILNETFMNLFKKLVPEGNASLELIDESNGCSDSLFSECRKEIKVYANFSSSSTTSKNLESLSGGEKTIVSIALIFAFQKIKPCPFYILDEIDQALDEFRRAAVANVIKELKKDAQFICTTFKPQLINVSDFCLKVTHEFKYSHASTVSKDEALHFLNYTRIETSSDEFKENIPYFPSLNSCSQEDEILTSQKAGSNCVASDDGRRP